MIGVAWKHDNVYIDTEAYLPRYYPPQFLQFLRTYGQDKVLFGMEQVRGLELPPDVEDKFLFANAQAVFHPGAAAT